MYLDKNLLLKCVYYFLNFCLIKTTMGYLFFLLITTPFFVHIEFVVSGKTSGYFIQTANKLKHIFFILYFFIFLINKLDYYGNFRFTIKLSRKYTEFPHSFSLNIHTASCVIDISSIIDASSIIDQSGAFVEMMNLP